MRNPATQNTGLPRKRVQPPILESLRGVLTGIHDGLGFSLVPWRPALEQHIGRHISGITMPGGDVDWSFGRKLGLGL